MYREIRDYQAVYKYYERKVRLDADVSEVIILTSLLLDYDRNDLKKDSPLRNDIISHL